MTEVINEIVHLAETESCLYALVVHYEEADGGNGVGLVLRTDGAREGDTETVLTTNDYLRSMWVSPSGAVWLSSEDGNVWTNAKVRWPKSKDPELDFDSFDATMKWQVTTLPNPQDLGHPPNLGAIWGTDDSNVYTAASNGPIYQWNGKAWNQVHTAIGTIRAFSGTSAQDVFAVGENGALLHFDGSTWRALSNPEGGRNDELFTGVNMSPDGSVYICSQDGRLLHGSASGLVALSQDSDLPLRGLAFVGKRLLLAAAEKGAAELQQSTLAVIKSNFHSTFITAGRGRWFFLDASTQTCYIEYDPRQSEAPWWKVTF
jgi:hypothetical protein